MENGFNIVFSFFFVKIVGSLLWTQVYEFQILSFSLERKVNGKWVVIARK